MNSMKSTIYAAALASLWALCGVSTADEKALDLKLNLEKGQTFVFEVTQHGTGTVPAPSDAPRPSPANPEKEKSSAQARDGETIQREPPRAAEEAASRALGQEHLEYRIWVQAPSGGETLLMVNVLPGISAGSKGGAATPGAEKVKPGETSGKTERAGGDADSKPLGVPLGTYSVRIDDRGHIRDIKRTGDPEAAGGSAWSSPMRTHLALILGSALHEKALKVGEVYGKTEPERPEKAAPVATPAAPAKSADLGLVRLRYEGTSKARDHETARFTVLGPEMSVPTPAGSKTDSGATSPPGATPPGTGRERAGEAKSDRPDDPSVARETFSAEPSQGEATFRLEDGVLDRVSIRVTGRDIARLPAPGKATSLTMRRLSEPGKEAGKQ